MFNHNIHFNFVCMEGSSDEVMEEIRNSLASITADQSTRLTNVTRRHDLVISNICEEVCEVKHLLKNLHGGTCSRGGDSSSKATRSIKLILPRFTGEDLQWWLY